MNNDINAYVTKSNQLDWAPLIENGINYYGIFVKSLRFNNKQQRSSTILLKFEPSAAYPYHNHPAGEELFVLEGSCIIEGATLSKGDYLYTPPNFSHDVKTNTGCVLLFIVPEEVELRK